MYFTITVRSTIKYLGQLKNISNFGLHPLFTVQNSVNGHLARHHSITTKVIQFQKLHGFSTGESKSSSNIKKSASRSPGLLKPFIFTLLFSSACFVGCTIWEYENMRKEVETFSRNNFSAKFKEFLEKEKRKDCQRLNRKAEQKFITGREEVWKFICAVNVLVYLAWKTPQLQPFMVRYFSSNPFSSVVCLPMILSTFSHATLLYLFTNMATLYTLSTAAGKPMSKEQFLEFYLTACIISSMASYMHKSSALCMNFTRGASGANMAMLTYSCWNFSAHENIKLKNSFIFLFTLFITSAVITDVISISTGLKAFDHAAHIGGALFGTFWTIWGNCIWRKRLNVMEFWHNLRSS